MFDVMITVSSYSHDIATAVLAACGATIWVLSKNVPLPQERDAALFFVRVYQGITRMAKDSLYWILLIGVPRVVYYKKYEWSDAAGDLQIAAIVIKHIIMFLLVGAGLYYWSQLSDRVRDLKTGYITG